MQKPTKRMNPVFPSAQESVRTASRCAVPTGSLQWTFMRLRFRVSSRNPSITFMQVHCSANMRGTSALLMKISLSFLPMRVRQSAQGAYANILGCNVAIGDKVRIGHDENPNALEIIGDVKGKTCMVVDDFTISGNTLCKVAYGLMDKGAKEIYAFLSHAIVKEDAVKRIEESPIKMLVTTDTVDNTDVLKNSKKIKVVSAAPLFAEAVRTIHEREPMAYMFEHLPARLMEMSFEDTDK